VFAAGEVENLPALEFEIGKDGEDGGVDGLRALGCAGDDESLKVGIELEAAGGVSAIGKTQNFRADGAAGGFEFFQMLGRNVLAGLLELSADGGNVAHQILVGFAGDDILIEDGGGDFVGGAVFDGDAGGVTA